MKKTWLKCFLEMLSTKSYFYVVCILLKDWTRWRGDYSITKLLHEGKKTKAVNSMYLFFPIVRSEDGGDYKRKRFQREYIF